MEYIYFLPNASLTVRVLNYLVTMPQFQQACVTVIHQINGWVIRIKTPNILSQHQDLDFRAFLSELGVVYISGIRMDMVFWSLDMKDSVIDVMRNYKVAIVSHGNPNIKNIENFTEQISQGLGYRPETLA